MRALRISDDDIDLLDHRDGHVCDRSREWLELHSFEIDDAGHNLTPQTFVGEALRESPRARCFLDSSLAFARACELRCMHALRALAAADGPSSPLHPIIAGEVCGDHDNPSAHGDRQMRGAAIEPMT